MSIVSEEKIKLLKSNPNHGEESLFSNKLLWPLLFFGLKWAEYLAVAGLNLLAQISDRISPFGV